MTKKKPYEPIGPSDTEGFDTFLARYLEWLGVENYADTTIEDRRMYLTSFGRWCVARSLLRPKEVTKVELERYQRHLYHFRQPNGRPLSSDTQIHRLVAVRGFFRFLTKKEHIAINPALDLELPKLERKLPKNVMSMAEVEQVLETIDTKTSLGLRDRAILETFYSTGIRRAELGSLQLTDLDTERGVIFVRRGKGRRDRVAPIGNRAIAWVSKYILESRPTLMAHIPDEDDSGALFVTRDGGPFKPHSLSYLVRGWISASEVKKSGACHVFRHTTATLMLENGADIRFIQAMLGHERLETTQVYTKVSIAKLKEVHSATHPAKLRGEGKAPPAASAGLPDGEDQKK